VIRLPARVPINGRWWSVKRRTLRRTFQNGQRSSTRKLLGLTVPDTRTIWISWGLKDADVLSTFLHEVIHASRPELVEAAVAQLEADIIGALARVKRS
jgi:hypothetical protein